MRYCSMSIGNNPRSEKKCENETLYPYNTTPDRDSNNKNPINEYRTSTLPTFE